MLEAEEANGRLAHRGTLRNLSLGHFTLIFIDLSLENEITNDARLMTRNNRETLRYVGNEVGYQGGEGQSDVLNRKKVRLELMRS